PEAFTEVRYLAHVRQLEVLRILPRLAGELHRAVGRRIRAVSPYRCEGADTVVVALGSVLGTLKDTVDALRGDGTRIGVLGLTAFRPFPFAEVATALADTSRVIVLERAFATGVGGIVTGDVRAAAPEIPVHTVVAGLGGRPVTSASLRSMLLDAVTGGLEPLTFLDLDRRVVDRELARAAATRRSGPTAENLLLSIRGGRR
ncbi:MAG TPA: transketolase C-terminal domain-containing protein, partial [Pilimelia sp.]|nr:transketolase C-terminal domain-containing protein [Pilimelia sp.]